MQSMTGFGSGEVQTADLHLTVEARSVNHRYLDVVFRYPRSYTPFEPRMKRLVGDYFARGRIDIKLVEQRGSAGRRTIWLDERLAQQYHAALQQLQERFQLPGSIDLAALLSLRELLTVEEADADLEAAWDVLARGLEEALQALRRMRQQEGEFLGRDLHERLQALGRQAEAIHQRRPQVVTAYQERLEQRVRELFQQFELDPNRLHQEAILFAERTDITEELVRLESHLQAFEGLLMATESVGRKMEFLLQEMHREVNTIASKSNDADISQRVVDMKSELEKMREQVQNVE
jgi:uncharacterized protein (TIGR00255 family)